LAALADLMVAVAAVVAAVVAVAVDAAGMIRGLLS
jgi:hypothetical protein